MGPEAFDAPAETALELWERLRTGRKDRFEGAKAISRACEVGLPILLPPLPMSQKYNGQPPPPVFLKVALWETSDAWAVVGMPRWIFAGFQAQMMVAGAQRCRWGVLLAGGAWRKGTMSASPEAQADLARAADAFQVALEKGVPPQPVGPADLDVIKRLFPEDDGTTVTLPEDARRMWERAKALRKQIRLAKKARAIVEAKLRKFLGTAAIGKMGGRRLGLRSVKTPGGHRGRRLVELS